jgi:PAS domain-containing protein
MVDNGMRASEISQYLYENAAIGIYQTSAAGGFEFANPAVACILGYDSLDDLKNSIADIDRQLFVDPSCRQEFHRLLKEKGCVRNFEAELYCRGRKKVWVRMQADAVADPKDDPGSSVSLYRGFLIDINEHKDIGSCMSFTESAL